MGNKQTILGLNAPPKGDVDKNSLPTKNASIVGI